MKKSQITMFFIFAIVLVAIAALVLYASKIIKKDNNGDIGKIDEDKNSIKEYIQDCLVQSSRPLVIEIAKKGGSLNPNGVYWERIQVNALATYKSGKGYENNLLLKQDMESELSSAIN